MTSPRETNYELLLDESIRVRVRFTRQQKQVTGFVVQLEYYLLDHWYPVSRYDTAHQFSHCDILRPDGRQEKRAMSVRNFNEALSYAQQDIMTNYRFYCTRFEEWLNE